MVVASWKDNPILQSARALHQHHVFHQAHFLARVVTHL